MSDSTPHISVIVPHYNDLVSLDHCLNCLMAQTLPCERFEVIVADNNSRCGIEAVRQLAGDRANVVPAPIQGAGPARNAGVEAARGEIFAFVDSDCYADPNWLVEGLKSLQTADYTGGRVDTSITDPAKPTIAEAYEAVFAFNFEKYINRDKFSGTGNLFVPRKVFDVVGPFRSGVSEDIEWCHRANSKGFRLAYVPTAIVTHPARVTWTALRTKYQRIVVENYLLNKEIPYGRLRWLIRAMAVGASPFVHMFAVFRSPRLPGLAPKVRGVIGLYAIRWYRFGAMLLEIRS